MKKPFKVSITREPDDELADARISIGKPRFVSGLYLVFRGEPETVVDILRDALAIAETCLPAGEYEDHRGRPQG